MSQLEEPSYDFFIAHAGADTSEAERLFDLLAQEVKVFLDSKSLMLGADWDRALAEAQRHSQVTVVLVSTRTDAAFYQREEIAAAIDLARKGEATHLVVPVYLDQSTDAVPYGLRLKHGVMVSDGLPIEKVAAKLIDLHRMLAPEATSVPERVAPQGPDQSRSLPQLLDQLFSRDPVLSLPAVVQLTKLGPEVIPDVVARLSGLNKVNIATVRTLLGRFPEESAPLMADRVLQAHRDWHAASVVPDCFTPNHQPFCADLLARHLTDDEPDVVRKCIESLGFMAAESFGYRLVELLDDFRHSDYFYGKYEYYVVLARARMLVLLESEGIVEQWQLPSAFSHVEKLIRESSRRGWVSLLYPHLQDVLAQCQARHADHLIT